MVVEIVVIEVIEVIYKKGIRMRKKKNKKSNNNNNTCGPGLKMHCTSNPVHPGTGVGDNDSMWNLGVCYGNDSKCKC